MVTQKISALWVGGNDAGAQSFGKTLKAISQDFVALKVSANVNDALTKADSQLFNIAFIDADLPHQSEEWWATFRQLCDRLPVVAVVQGDGEEFVFSALKNGAVDFLHAGDQDAHSVLKTLRHALQIHALVKQASNRRQAIEAQFLASQRMESVGRLALNIAHDFNNLLTVILNYSQMVLAKAKDDETLRNRMEAINNCANRAATITSQFLAFGRRHRPQPQALSLASTFSMVEPMLRQIVGSRIDLVISEQEQGLRVMMDPGHLMHLLVSMVQSAQETMPDGGDLSLKVFSQFVDDDISPNLGHISPGEYVVISVKDTGRGFDKESTEHIFELFGGEGSSAQATPPSLSAIYGLVKHAGGHIAVQSEVGKGTRYDIYLPRFIEEKPLTVEVEKKESAPQKSLETVLVVDDEDLVRKIAVEVMTQSGYRVIEASSAIEALKICEQKDAKVDLILTDLIMPKMNGPELVRKMVARNPHIRVVYMSGYNDDAVEHIESLETQEAFVQKPFLPKSLLGAVKDALGRPT